MRAQILKRLAEIEQQNQITIVYACESGSRAWGFESIDSDYDVRFLYVHNPEWYLSIDQKPDYINDVGKVLDFGGWELRKALGLFKASNASLLEKLISPIVYIDRDNFAQEMYEQRELYFRPISCVYHYTSLAKKVVKEELGKPQVKLKRCFYAVRSMLCARWILEHNETARMELDILKDVATPFLKEWINGYLPIKKEVDESFLITGQNDLRNHLTELIEDTERLVKQLDSSPKVSSYHLNEILRKWISKEYIEMT